MAGDLAPIPAPHFDVPAVPALPTVKAGDMYAALLADAAKDATRRAREQDIADLGGFLGATDPRILCAQLVTGTAGQMNAVGTAYRNAMLKDGLSAATINRRLSTLRKLAKLARRFEVCDWSPEFDGLRSTPYRDTRGPGADGMRALVDLAKSEATTPKGKRDWSILSLFYTAGLRRGELAAINYPDDVDLGERRVQIIGKGRHEAEWVPMGVGAAAAMAGWLEARGHGAGPLYVRLDTARISADRLSGDGIHYIISELGRRAGIKRGLWPHALRHAAASRASEATGGNHRKVQSFTRHTDPKTVQLYIDRLTDDAASVASMLDEDL